MISERLDALSREDAELVVTALGSQRSFYLCWKTPDGRYHQDSHGLQQRLYDWLFPGDGGTRDFDTLRVVLGPGDGFLAVDRHGKIEHKSARLPERPQLKRASTIGLERPSESGAAGFTRHRSQTTSSVASSWRNSSLSSRSSISSVSSAGSGPAPATATAQPRKVRVIPIAVKPQTNSLSRRQSDLSLLERSSLEAIIAQSPPPPMDPVPPLSSSIEVDEPTAESPSREPVNSCTCGCHHSSDHSPVVRAKTAPWHRRAYPSASGPRDLSGWPDEWPERQTKSNEEVPGWRNQLEEQTTPDPQVDPWRNHTVGVGGGPIQNPIIMGRMQEYFRSSGYRLGDSLTCDYNAY